MASCLILIDGLPVSSNQSPQNFLHQLTFKVPQSFTEFEARDLEAPVLPMSPVLKSYCLHCAQNSNAALYIYIIFNLLLIK